jgi:hypothetical protein
VDRDLTPYSSRAAVGEYGAAYNDSWAVVIGINRYPTRPLACAVNDADAFARVLVDKLDFSRDNVFAILDPAPDMEDAPYTGYSTKGDKESIERLLLTDLPAKVAREDRVIVFFAGHGHLLTTGPGDPGIGYLVPAEGTLDQPHTLIPMETLTREQSRVLAAKHVFYLFDCCYSGQGATRGQPTPPRFTKDMVSHKARQLLTAGTSVQVVQDNHEGTGHSLFTHELLNALSGAAFQPSAGFISATLLHGYLQTSLAAGRPESADQLPLLAPLTDHDAARGGDFVFHIKQVSHATAVPRLVVDGGMRPHQVPWGQAAEEDQLAVARVMLPGAIRHLAASAPGIDPRGIGVPDLVEGLVVGGVLPPDAEEPLVSFLAELDRTRFGNAEEAIVHALVAQAETTWRELAELQQRSDEDATRRKSIGAEPDNFRFLWTLVHERGYIGDYGEPMSALARIGDSPNWNDVLVGADLQPLVVWLPPGEYAPPAAAQNDNGEMAHVVTAMPPGAQSGTWLLTPADEGGLPLAALVHIITRDGEVPIATPRADQKVAFPESIGVVRDRASLADGRFRTRRTRFASGEVGDVLVGQDSRPVRFWVDASELGMAEPGEPLWLCVLVATEAGLLAVQLDDRLRPVRLPPLSELQDP